MAEILTAKYSAEKLKQIREECLSAYASASTRGLVYSAKWVSELSLALESYSDNELSADVSVKIPGEELTKYCVAKSYYELKEYERAAALVKSCTSSACCFLYYYCVYLAGESKQPHTELFEKEVNTEQKEYLLDLMNDLGEKSKDDLLDGYLNYLYGIVLKKLAFHEDAQSAFLSAVKKEPCLWSAWLELSATLTDRNELMALDLPDHWIKPFFMANALIELQLSDQALNIYQHLTENGFKDSWYVMAQTAVAFDNMKNVQATIEQFKLLLKLDPHRLENMDTYSNALYVMEMRTELANLAYRCVGLDKYRAETCCVVGNYYSARGQHEHAVINFQRALKLNSKFISAWTLMGHEYMEMRNQSAAIQAYQQALEIDPRDFRAWYGLGQTHEILKMPFYSLYYFQQAMKLRPNDSRMLMAVGLAYEKLEKCQEAKICFWKAHMLGDAEGIALVALAKLHEKLGEHENAAAAFTKYVIDNASSVLFNPKDMSHAYKFLANHHVKNENFEEAYVAAQKCIDFPETREEGKTLLNQITSVRGVPSEHGEPAAPSEANDSLTSDLFYRNSPVPHLSPMNLNFHTP